VSFIFQVRSLGFTESSYEELFIEQQTVVDTSKCRLEGNSYEETSKNSTTHEYKNRSANREAQCNHEKSNILLGDPITITGNYKDVSDRSRNFEKKGGGVSPEREPTLKTAPKNWGRVSNYEFY
jgi:hypothetical protein